MQSASVTAQLIADVTHRLTSICPYAPKFILGDFNHCNLNKTLRTYEQYASCATTWNNTIDLCYGSVSGAYKSLPMASPGTSYHSSVCLMPTYTPSFKRLECQKKKVSTEDSISSFQTCFECIDWQCFMMPVRKLTHSQKLSCPTHHFVSTQLSQQKRLLFSLTTNHG